MGVVALLTISLAAPASAADEQLAPLADPARVAPFPESFTAGDEVLAGVDTHDHGGYSVDAASGRLTIYVVGGRRADSAKRIVQQAALASTANVARSALFEQVRYSAAELARIERDEVWQFSASENLGVVATRLDYRLNKVVVSLDVLTGDARRALRVRFGDAVAVRQEPIGRIYATRYNDPAPHYGGARILLRAPGGGAANACTSGYPATYRLTGVMVTAGHCAALGFAELRTAVTNGALQGEDNCQTVGGCDRQPFGTVWRTGLTTFASVADAQSNPAGLDMALITTQASPKLYVAGDTTSVADIVSFPGASRNIAGTNVCHSGATTVGSCGYTVGSGQVTRVFSVSQGGVTRFGRALVWEALRTSGTGTACPGDSGAPIYQPFGAGVSILGSLTGSAGTAVGNCTAGFIFTYWGSAPAVWPGFLPTITS
ncbi:hypothetical protein CS0771_60350 [Catellatospora sp. IY07-71]|nr:hypothetical protein CS0771_60350 [Catellatospora sp. IY07-71]